MKYPTRSSLQERAGKIRRQAHRKGFTLVEILIVIVIIGILAGSLLLIMGTTRDNAEAARIISEMRTMKSAAVLYKSDYGMWPKWVKSGAYNEEGELEYIDIQGNALPYAYTDRIPTNENYWIGVMHASDPTGEDIAFVALDGQGLRQGVKKILALKADEMGFMAAPGHGFAGLGPYTAEDDSLIWFLTAY